MKNIVYCLLMVLFLSCKGQSQNDLFLLPYQVGDKWGLADTLGNIKVKPQYDEMIDFNIQPRKYGSIPPNSFYYVRKNNEIYFIDAGNNRYFKDYELIKSQNEKRVLFKKNGKVGFQRPSFDTGEWKLIGDPTSYKYDNIYNYPDANSLFTLIVINKKKGLMFYDGEIIIPTEYDSISYSKSLDVWDFNAYQLDSNKKIIQTKKYTKSINLPPPPGILNKNKDSNLLERKEMGVLYKKSYNLSNYNNVYYYRDLLPAIVKDNNSNKFGIVATLKPEKIDFLYDDIFTVEYHISGEKEKYKAYVFKKGDTYGLFDKSDNKYIPYPYEYDAIKQKYYMINDINSSALPYEMPYLVFSKKNKYGVESFDIKLYNMIPFEYDDIIERNIIVKNKMFGIWDNTHFRTIHIAPRYLSKPKLIKEISFSKGKAFVYEVLNKENKKILVYRNGLELYKKN